MRTECYKQKSAFRESAHMVYEQSLLQSLTRDHRSTPQQVTKMSELLDVVPEDFTNFDDSGQGQQSEKGWTLFDTAE